MRLINLYIKCVLNNVFITIVQSNNNKVIYNQSMGKFSFFHRNKHKLEAFKFLVSHIENYIQLNSFIIQHLNFFDIPRSKFKIIKKVFKEYHINQIQIIQKISYNGCRSKKKKSMSK